MESETVKVTQYYTCSTATTGQTTFHFPPLHYLPPNIYIFIFVLFQATHAQNILSLIVPSLRRVRCWFGQMCDRICDTDTTGIPFLLLFVVQCANSQSACARDLWNVNVCVCMCAVGWRRGGGSWVCWGLIWGLCDGCSRWELGDKMRGLRSPWCQEMMFYSFLPHYLLVEGSVMSCNATVQNLTLGPSRLNWGWYCISFKLLVFFV